MCDVFCLKYWIIFSFKVVNTRLNEKSKLIESEVWTAHWGLTPALVLSFYLISGQLISNELVERNTKGLKKIYKDLNSWSCKTAYGSSRRHPRNKQCELWKSKFNFFPVSCRCDNCDNRGSNKEALAIPLITFSFGGFVTIHLINMSQLLLLGRVKYGGGPIFKVVLEC